MAGAGGESVFESKRRLRVPWEQSKYGLVDTWGMDTGARLHARVSLGSVSLAALTELEQRPCESMQSVEEDFQCPQLRRRFDKSGHKSYEQEA